MKLSQQDPELSSESNSWSDIFPIVCCFEKMFAWLRASFHITRSVIQEANGRNYHKTQLKICNFPDPSHLLQLPPLINIQTFSNPLFIATPFYSKLESTWIHKQITSSLE